MRYILGIALFTILIAGCKSSSKIPAGAPEKMKLKELLKKVEDAENTFTTLNIKANGSYKDQNSSQSFKAQIRILKDSLIWVDIADPILGIKVARAIIYKDSVAFVNRLQKEYYTGSVNDLLKKLNLNFGFEILQDILAANVAFPIDRSFDLDYQPGYYVLADHEREARGNTVTLKGKDEEMHLIWIDPVFYKAKKQELKETLSGYRYELEYAGVKPRGGMLYPNEIKLKIIQKAQTTLELELKDIDKNENLNYPFTIPSSYAEMR